MKYKLGFYIPEDSRHSSELSLLHRYIVPRLYGEVENERLAPNLISAASSPAVDHTPPPLQCVLEPVPTGEVDHSHLVLHEVVLLFPLYVFVV
jgi:hypothetical protein